MAPRVEKGVKTIKEGLERALGSPCENSHHFLILSLTASRMGPGAGHHKDGTFWDHVCAAGEGIGNLESGEGPSGAWRHGCL